MLDPTKPSSPVFTHGTQENRPYILPQLVGADQNQISLECQSIILERLATQFGIESDQPLKSAKEFTPINNKNELGDQIKNVIIKTRSLFKTSHEKINSDEFKALNANINTLFEKSHELKNENLITKSEEALACESLEQLKQILLNYDDWTDFQQRMNTFDAQIEDSAFIVSDSMYSPQRGMNLSALEELGNAVNNLKLLFKDSEKRMGDIYPFAEETLKQLAYLNRSPCWMGTDYLEGLDHIGLHIATFEKLYTNAADTSINNDSPLERLQQQTEARQEFERLGLFLSNLQSTLSVLTANLEQLQKTMANVHTEDKSADVGLAAKMIGKDVQQFLDRIASTQRNLPETFQKLNAAIGRCHMENPSSLDPLKGEMLDNPPAITRETFKIIDDYYALRQENVSPEIAIENYIAAKRKLESIASMFETLANAKKGTISDNNLQTLQQLQKTISTFQSSEESHLQNNLHAPFNFEDAIRDRIINDATAATASDSWISRAWRSLDPDTWSESTKKYVSIGLATMQLSSEMLKIYQTSQEGKPVSKIQAGHNNLTAEQKKIIEKEMALLGVLCSDKYQTLTEDNIENLTKKLPDGAGREAVREVIREIIHTHGDQAPDNQEISTIIGQYAKARAASMQGSANKMLPPERPQVGTSSNGPESSTTNSYAGIFNTIGTTLKGLIFGTGKVISAFSPDIAGNFTTTDQEIKIAVNHVVAEGFESARETNGKLSGALHQNLAHPVTQSRMLANNVSKLRHDLHTAIQENPEEGNFLASLADRQIKLETAAADADNAIKATKLTENTVSTAVEVHVEDLIGFVNEIGGAHFEQNILVPNNHDNINSVLNGLITPLSDYLGDVGPAVTSDSYLWKNLCKTPEELHVLAEQKKDYFKDNLKAIAKKTGAEANFGPGERFATKQLDSLKAKIEKDVKNIGMSEEVATAKMFDALRGTIIADTPEQLLESINGFKKWVKEINGKIIFRNHLKGLHPNGYIGIHANVLIPEGQSENEGILSEVQFHLRKYNDGTLSGAKEFNHEYYKSTLPIKAVNYASKTVTAFALCHMLNVCIRPSIILKNQLALVPLTQPIQTEEIGAIKTMSRLMETRGSLIITDAPGSCKTELLDLALTGSTDVFNLKEEFLQFHFKEMGITDSNEQKRIKQEGYDLLKDKQLIFIQNNLKQVEKELLESPNQIIVMDKLDIVETDLVQGDSLTATLALIEMAGRLKNQGKKIVVVLHLEGLKTPAIMNALKAAHLLEENDNVVQPRFFTDKEQHQILEWAGFSDEDAASYVKLAQGLPAAYLEILKRVKHHLENKKEGISITEKEALKFAKTQVAKNLKVMRQITPENISALITGLAKGTTNELDCFEHKDALIETGLVAFENDQVILSPLVIDAIEMET